MSTLSSSPPAPLPGHGHDQSVSNRGFTITVVVLVMYFLFCICKGIHRRLRHATSNAGDIETGSEGRDRSTSQRETDKNDSSEFVIETEMLLGIAQQSIKSAVRLKYIHKDLRVNAEELHQLRMSVLRNLRLKKKLCLILDLDQTLLHTVCEYELSSKMITKLRDENPSLFKTRVGSSNMITKLRPYVKTFLEEASQMFDMHVYTHGIRDYALAMTRLLDPERKYFDFKVICIEDSTDAYSKTLDVVLAPESVVVILDDNETLWDKHRENLIVVKEYDCFDGNPSWFGFGGFYLKSGEEDESEIDGELAGLLKKLKRVHQMYYEKELGDVRKALKTVNKKQLL